MISVEAGVSVGAELFVWVRSGAYFEAGVGTCVTVIGVRVVACVVTDILVGVVSDAVGAFGVSIGGHAVVAVFGVVSDAVCAFWVSIGQVVVAVVGSVRGSILAVVAITVIDVLVGVVLYFSVGVMLGVGAFVRVEAVVKEVVADVAVVGTGAVAVR